MSMAAPLQLDRSMECGERREKLRLEQLVRPGTRLSCSSKSDPFHTVRKRRQEKTFRVAGFRIGRENRSGQDPIKVRLRKQKYGVWRFGEGRDGSIAGGS